MLLDYLFDVPKLFNESFDTYCQRKKQENINKKYPIPIFTESFDDYCIRQNEENIILLNDK